MHYDNLTNLQRSQDKIKSGQSEQEQQAIRIMTDYQNMMLWLDKLVMDLPVSARNAVRDLIEPHIAMLKSIVTIIKETNPELAKWRMYDSLLDNDSTKSGFSTI